MPEVEKSLLVHVCCAPCLSGLAEYLKSLEFTRIKGYFYNPNIHPYREFKKRRHHVLMNEKHFGFDEFEYSDDYPLHETIKGMLSFENRCEYCYRIRLEETTRKARDGEFSHFTSTLLISPFQNQELLTIVGNEMGLKYNVKFLNDDMRKFYDLSRKIAHEKEIYMQGYCGCIFSEYERCRSKNNKKSRNVEDD